jgi:pimeloyl-ACP methyl ester carboxylesterase
MSSAAGARRRAQGTLIPQIGTRRFASHILTQAVMMEGEGGVEGSVAPGGAAPALGALREGTHVVDGIRAAYTVADPPEAQHVANTPPLVLVHGLGGNSAHFSKNLQQIAAAYGGSVYAVDLIGFGRSAKPLGVDYSEALWAWQIHSLMEDVVRTEQVFLAGNSLGGYLAMLVAATHPAQVAGLCIMNAIAPSGVINPSGLDVPLFRLPPVADALAGQALAAASSPKGVRETLKDLYSDPAALDENMVSSLVFTGRAASGRQLFASLFRSQPGRRWEELLVSDELGLGLYEGPVLALWGERDTWMPPQVLEPLRERSAGLDVALLPAGHCPHDEAPAAANARLAAWMREVLSEGRNRFEISRVPRYKKLPLSPRYIN